MALSPLVAVEYEPAGRTQSGLSGPHAGDNSADVGDFFRAKPEGVGPAGGFLRGRLGEARCWERDHANSDREKIAKPAHVGAGSDLLGAQINLLYAAAHFARARLIGLA
jgi:hypothetical protein